MPKTKQYIKQLRTSRQNKDYYKMAMGIYEAQKIYTRTKLKKIRKDTGEAVEIV